MEVLNQSYDMPDAPKYFPYTPRRRSLSESNGCENLSDSTSTLSSSLTESGGFSLSESAEIHNNNSDDLEVEDELSISYE